MEPPADENQRLHKNQKGIAMYVKDDVLARAARKPLASTWKLKFEPPKAQRFSLGIIICDGNIGQTETLRRLLNTFAGDPHPGSIGKAKCVDFIPAEHSAEDFAPHLDSIEGHWANGFRDIGRLRLVQLCECDEWCSCHYDRESCEICCSSDLYAALDRHGLTVGFLCNTCGHFSGFTWLLRSAVNWPANESELASTALTARCP